MDYGQPRIGRSRFGGVLLPRKTAPDAPAASYESLMERLRQVVERLETGELPLAESLALYEEGVQISARCQRLLDDAELRVQQLLAGTDGVELSDWNDS
jgi:exodeoxyribonuclease VII small subunit